MGCHWEQDWGWGGHWEPWEWGQLGVVEIGGSGSRTGSSGSHWEQGGGDWEWDAVTQGAGLGLGGALGTPPPSGRPPGCGQPPRAPGPGGRRRPSASPAARPCRRPGRAARPASAGGSPCPRTPPLGGGGQGGVRVSPAPPGTPASPSVPTPPPHPRDPGVGVGSAPLQHHLGVWGGDTLLPPPLPPHPTPCRGVSPTSGSSASSR